MKALSLFSSAGIADMGLVNANIDVVLANELLPVRGKLHEFWHPATEVVVGSITEKEIKKMIISKSLDQKVNFVLCTPPCQGVSLIGKNKSQEDFIKDSRNHLLLHAIEVMNEISPDYILIENVPRYLKLYLPWKGDLIKVKDILLDNFGDKYQVEEKIYNATSFGLAQSRERAFFKVYKKDKKWFDPELVDTIKTLEEAIGHLPSLEAGEKSEIKNHFAREHTDEHVLCMKNTPTGKSALENEIYYPKNIKTGKKVKAYKSSYKRMSWNAPSPTITMRNDAISSQINVHPGRKLEDGTYSDARVLTLRELFILSSINPDIDLPDYISESQIRYMIGESVPPIMIEKIVRGIEDVEKKQKENK